MTGYGSHREGAFIGRLWERDTKTLRDIATYKGHRDRPKGYREGYREHMEEMLGCILHEVSSKHLLFTRHSIIGCGSYKTYNIF